jgi:hypothetical protein
MESSHETSRRTSGTFDLFFRFCRTVLPVCALLVPLLSVAQSTPTPTPEVDSEPTVAPSEYQMEDGQWDELPEYREENSYVFERRGDRARRAIFSAGPTNYRDKARNIWRRARLQSRLDGAERRYDRLLYDLRIGDNGIAIGDRDEGWGVRWLEQSRPDCNLATHRCTVTRQSLDWHWIIRPDSVELRSDPVTASRGPKRYSFPVQLLGTMEAAVVEEGSGDLVAPNGWRMSRPVILGADKLPIPDAAVQWTVLTSPLRYAIDVDDSALPAEAYPYVIDPTFTQLVNTYSGYIYGQGTLANARTVCDGGASTTYVFVGMNRSGTTRTVNRGYLNFELASKDFLAYLPTAVTLYLYLYTDNSTTDFNMCVAVAQFGPLSTSTGDACDAHFVHPLYSVNCTNPAASFATSSIVSGWNSISLDTAYFRPMTGASNISFRNQLVLVSSRDLAGTDPTDGVTEYVGWTRATSNPYLSIDYVTYATPIPTPTAIPTCSS